MLNTNRNMVKGMAALMLMTSLSGCGMWSRIQRIGQEPPLSPIVNPVEAKAYEPVSMPMPSDKVAASAPNSLWRKGSSGFFKDQRASKVGDIITVKVSAKDTLPEDQYDNEELLIKLTVCRDW